MSRLVNWSKQSIVSTAAWNKIYEAQTGFLLQESGGFLLQESGGKLIIRVRSGTDWTVKID